MARIEMVAAIGHGRVVVAVVGVLLAFPSVAFGVATVSISGTTITYTGDGARDAVEVDVVDHSSDQWFQFTAISNGQAIGPIPPCETESGNAVCSKNANDLVFNLGGDNDFATANHNDLRTFVGFTDTTSEQHGGAGSDQLVGGIANDSLFGDADNDLLRPNEGGGIVNGGDGNDTIIDVLGGLR